ncbi:MAG: GGDEF domain-containing protein [Mariprofundaceae bacterium]|nr:GGDEF domain-containing protein [Mariprofundaceae bacterium]
MKDKAKRLKNDSSRVVILGGGRGGLAMLEILHDESLAEVIGVVDVDEIAIGMLKARELGVQTFYNVETALLACAPCVAFNLTNNEKVEKIAAGILGSGGVIGGLEGRLMWQMLTYMKESKNHLEYLAMHDSLTGLCNRRYVSKQLEREVSHAMRYGVECSLAILDLDHFKQVNDTHGHLSGDIVLKYVADVLQKNIRASDVLGRWGGEEFLVVLPHTSEKNATHAIQKCLDALKKDAVELLDGTHLNVSFSAGVASVASLAICPEKERNQDVNECMNVFLELVDSRLYQAKGQGRSCVVGVNSW